MECKSALDVQYFVCQMCWDHENISGLSNATANCFFFYPATNEQRKCHFQTLGYTLLRTASFQMSPHRQRLQEEDEESFKLSPRFAQKTTRDIMLHATLLFLLCGKHLVLQEQMRDVRLLKRYNKPVHSWDLDVFFFFFIQWRRVDFRKTSSRVTSCQH